MKVASADKGTPTETNALLNDMLEALNVANGHATKGEPTVVHTRLTGKCDLRGAKCREACFDGCLLDVSDRPPNKASL